MNNNELKDIAILYEKAKRADQYAEAVEDIHALLYRVVDRAAKEHKYTKPLEFQGVDSMEQYKQWVVNEIFSHFTKEDMEALYCVVAKSRELTQIPIINEVDKVFNKGF